MTEIVRACGRHSRLSIVVFSLYRRMHSGARRHPAHLELTGLIHVDDLVDVGPNPLPTAHSAPAAVEVDDAQCAAHRNQRRPIPLRRRPSGTMVHITDQTQPGQLRRVLVHPRLGRPGGLRRARWGLGGRPTWLLECVCTCRTSAGALVGDGCDPPPVRAPIALPPSRQHRHRPTCGRALWPYAFRRLLKFKPGGVPGPGELASGSSDE